MQKKENKRRAPRAPIVRKTHSPDPSREEQFWRLYIQLALEQLLADGQDKRDAK